MMKLKIQIKNKNIVSGVASWYYIDNDCILIENYNEQLDSFQCRLSHLASKIDLDILDNVTIVDDDNKLETRYMVISSYNWVEESLDNTTYQAELQMCSETKLLEGCLCANLSITPLRQDSRKRPVLFYLNEYLKQYGEKQRKYQKEITRICFAEVSNGTANVVVSCNLTDKQTGTVVITSLTNGVTVNSIVTDTQYTITLNITSTKSQVASFKIAYTKNNFAMEMRDRWSFSNNVLTRFANVIAPEKQWNEPTLRELLNDLMMVDDCIIVLKNEIIDYIDITAIGNEIQNYNYQRRSKDINSYLSDLQMNMQNVLQTSISGTKDTCLTVEYIPFTSEDYQITSDNLVIKTKYPILNIKSLVLCGFTKTISEHSEPTTVKPVVRIKDFCNVDGYSLVKEFKEYQTLDITYSHNFSSSDTGAYYSQYQNYCVYFNRNGREITGFNNATKRWKITSWTYTVWEWWKMITNGESLPALQRERSPYYDLFWKIEYETTINQKFRAGKGEYRNSRVITDNQTNSWVDAYTQGNLEYQKANRLGNETNLINQRCEVGVNFTPIKIGDKKTENDGVLICYQTQYEILQDHIEVNAFFTKDYVLRDYFTGVNSKIRTWVNAKDEAFERQDLIKYNLEFSWDRKNEIPYSHDIVGYCLTPFTSSNVNYLKNVVVRTNGSNPSVNAWYSYDLVSRIIGNSIVFTFGFDDSTIAGRYVDVGINDIDTTQTSFEDEIICPIIKSSVLTSLGGVPTKDYFYTDENFETQSIRFQLVSAIDISAGSYPTLTNNLQLTQDQSKQVLVKQFQLPKVDAGAVNSNNVIIDENRQFRKDNKEIPITTMQLEFSSETKDIYFTKLWLENQEAIRTVQKEDIKFGLVPISQWRIGKQNYTNITELDDYWVFYKEKINNSCSRCLISTDGIEEPEDMKNNFLVVYNSKGVLLAIKPNIESCKYVEFYMNMLITRDTGIYNNDGTKYSDIRNNG